MGLTIAVTELAPEEYESRSFFVANLLLQEVPALPLRGDEGAADLLLPAIFDDDDSTVLTDEESDLAVDLITRFVYLDEDVVRDDDLFELELAIGALDSKGGSSSTRLSSRFEGRDFEFGDGSDQIFGVGGSNRLLGGDGVDLITGAEGDDTIFGGKQGDLIDGGRGKDLIKGGGGADEIFGGDNDDTIFGLACDDILDGGDGVDSLLGGKGDDDLSGGGANDTLRGGAGSDTLNGGSGDDLLDGQGKTDTFAFEGGWGNDTIDGYSPSDTGGADDLLSIEGVLDLATFNSFAAQAGDDVLFDNGTSTIRILDVELSDFSNADFI